MDFGTLLHVAKKNNEDKKSAEAKYYSTKFSAPKKVSKEKTLSDNIKRFLAKKEREEREKARLEKEKRDQLLALRDDKSKNKIKKMLKVIKSANKSVLEDAVDTEDTAITLQGPDQPDEDDYGYVSQEAAAFYRKYMDKVKTLPDENKFSASRPSSKNDLSGTKDRVRAAIQKEQEEKMNPTRSKSSKSSVTTTTTTTTTSTIATSVTGFNSTSHRKKDIYDPNTEKELDEKKRREEEQKKVKLKKLAPPPLDFKELLKLAEKKQHEPLEIVVDTKKEPERLLTKKERRELEERQRYFEEKERRKKEGNQNPNKSQVNGKIVKTESKDPPSLPSTKIPPKTSTQKIVPSGSSVTSSKDAFKKPLNVDQQPPMQKTPNSSKSKMTNSDQKNNNPPINGTKVKPQGHNGSSSNNSSGGGFGKPTPPTALSTANSSKSTSSKAIIAKSSASGAKPTSALSSTKANYNGPTRQFPPKETQAIRKSTISSDKDIKPRQFPPLDVHRSRQLPPPGLKNSKSQKKAPKRRILDDDDSEYDSELDDFIDDGPDEDQNYSNYIKEIFGYDKSRYRTIEEEDDATMESSFAQQMKEEYLSKKIGLMEDLEDMRIEAEEKRKKTLIKKKKTQITLNL